ncbi:hypothetical protein DYB32_003849, partial [Aphanomyces invadans]
RNRQRDQRDTYVTGIRYTSSGCGASWIAPKVLLAAAGGRASFGGVALLGGTKDGERIKIVQQTMHPKFNEDDTTDDDFSTFDTESKVAPVKVKSRPQASCRGCVASALRVRTPSCSKRTSQALVQRRL